MLGNRPPSPERKQAPDNRTEESPPDLERLAEREAAFRFRLAAEPQQPTQDRALQEVGVFDDEKKRSVAEMIEVAQVAQRRTEERAPSEVQIERLRRRAAFSYRLTGIRGAGHSARGEDKISGSGHGRKSASKIDPASGESGRQNPDR